MTQISPGSPSHSGDSSPRVRTKIQDGEFTATAIEAIAEAKGTTPDQLTIQLYDYIESDAVELLTQHVDRHDDASWRLEFEIDEFTVSVDSDGYVVVY